MNVIKSCKMQILLTATGWYFRVSVSRIIKFWKFWQIFRHELHFSYNVCHVSFISVKGLLEYIRCTAPILIKALGHRTKTDRGYFRPLYFMVIYSYLQIVNWVLVKSTKICCFSFKFPWKSVFLKDCNLDFTLL